MTRIADAMIAGAGTIPADDVYGGSINAPSGLVPAGVGMPYEEPPPPPQCSATKRDGTPCTASPAPNNELCIAHIRVARRDG